MEESRHNSLKNKNGKNIKIDIDGLNVKNGIAMTSGNEDKYIQLLSFFYKETLVKIREVRKSLDMGDIKLYIVHVHALKSAIAIIGGDALSKSALALENAGKHGDLDFIHANNTVFISELEALLYNINLFLSEVDSGNKENFNNNEQLKTELSRLRAALIAMDSTVINSAADALRGFTRAPQVGDTVSTILQNKLIGAYDDAITMIDKLVLELGK